MEDHQFTWILRYIWKGQNNKVFNNIDVDLCGNRIRTVDFRLN